MQAIDFYFASLASFFAFCGIILVILWHIQKNKQQDTNALLFLSLAMLTLSLSAVHYFISSRENESVKILVERILSLVSNMFLVFSLPYFKVGYAKLSSRWHFLQKIDNRAISGVLFFSGLVVLFSLLSDWKIDNFAIGQVTVVLLETLVTSVVLLVFGYCLGEVFSQLPIAKPFRLIVWIVLLVLVISQIMIAFNQLFAIRFLIDNILFLTFPTFISFLCLAALVMLAGLTCFFANRINSLNQENETTIEMLTNKLHLANNTVLQKEQETEELKTKLQQFEVSELASSSNLTPLSNALAGNNLNEKDVQNPISTDVPSLKIGFENYLYFFEFSLPKCNIASFRYENHKIVNVFLFLLFYAVARKKNLYHQKNTINGYNISMFNNALIQALNVQLAEAGLEKITKDNLLHRTKQGRFELNIDPENINLININNITKESDRHSIAAILSILDIPD